MSADNPRPRGSDKPAESDSPDRPVPIPEAETHPRRLHEPRSMAEHSADVHSRPPIPGYNPFAKDGNYIVEPGHEFGPPPADRRATPPPASRAEVRPPLSRDAPDTAPARPQDTARPPQTQTPELSERSARLHPSATPDTPRQPDVRLGSSAAEKRADEKGFGEQRLGEQRWAAIEQRLTAVTDQAKAELQAEHKARIAEVKAELDAKLGATKAELDKQLASLKDEIGKLRGENEPRGHDKPEAEAKPEGKDKPGGGDQPQGVDRPDPTRPSHPDIPARYPADYPRSSYDTPKPQVEGPHVSPEDWVEEINPGYESGDDNRQLNCGECARAVDGTWQGYPKVAEAIDASRLGGEDKERMEEWAGTECTDASMADIKQELDRLGPGSSAVVGVLWNNSRRGHWFNAVNDAGTVKAVDGQIGETEIWPPSNSGLGFSEARMRESFVIYVKPDGKIAK